MNLRKFLELLEDRLKKREVELDQKNRKGLVERDYFMNCGRLQQLEEMRVHITETVDKLRKNEEIDDDEI